MADEHVVLAEHRLAAAQAAKAAEAPPEWLVEAQKAHEVATLVLDKAKALCDEGCSHEPDADAETVALAQLHHAGHRGEQEAAYAEFARTGHALDPSTPQAASHPATPGGVTEVAAQLKVDSDLSPG